MDSGVQTALLAMFGDYRDGAMDVITATIPIAAVVLITVGVAIFAINFFKKFMHG